MPTTTYARMLAQISPSRQFDGSAIFAYRRITGGLRKAAFVPAVVRPTWHRCRMLRKMQAFCANVVETDKTVGRRICKRASRTATSGPGTDCRPRIRRASTILRCTKRRRGTSGISLHLSSQAKSCVSRSICATGVRPGSGACSEEQLKSECHRACAHSGWHCAAATAPATATPPTLDPDRSRASGVSVRRLRVELSAATASCLGRTVTTPSHPETHCAWPPVLFPSFRRRAHLPWYGRP